MINPQDLSKFVDNIVKCCEKYPYTFGFLVFEIDKLSIESLKMLKKVIEDKIKEESK